MRSRVLPLVLVALSGLWTASFAQWSQVGPPVFKPNIAFSGGAITYGHGVVWAGAEDLWKSTDLGLTWTKTSMPPSRVFGIAAFDDKIIAVATVDRGVLVTSDQGASWRNIRSRSSVKVSFGDDAQTILSCNSSEFVRTTNFGQQWSALPALFTGSSFHSNGTRIYHIGDRHLWYSTTNGASWTATPGIFDRDCWDFAIDSCDPSTIVVVNEELYLIDDNRPVLNRTTNAGSTWQTMTPFGKYCGNVATSQLQMFVQTLDDGVIISNDHGASWKLMGGPIGGPDQSMMSVLEDSVLLVADSSGQLWRTPIASIPHPFATPSSLFANDSIVLCDAPILRQVVLQRACEFVDSVSIAGIDADRYSIESMSSAAHSDTLLVSFDPRQPGSYVAELEIRLTTGEIVRIPLSGTAVPAVEARLASTTLSARAIGEDIDVPVEFSNATRTTQASMVLDYDPGLLQFRSAHNADGSILPVTDAPLGHISATVSTVGASNGSPSAHFLFRWFPGKTASTSVRLDSLRVTSLAGDCVFAVDTGAIVSIEGVDDCSNELLSDYLRYGISGITLRPNPATHAVTIGGLESGIDIRVRIQDVGGRSVLEITGRTSASGELRLSLPSLPDGLYDLQLGTDGTLHHPLMIQH